MITDVCYAHLVQNLNDALGRWWHNESVQFDMQYRDPSEAELDQHGCAFC